MAHEPTAGHTGTCAQASPPVPGPGREPPGAAACADSDRTASLRFILLSAFLSTLGSGLVLPVLPVLVGRFVAAPSEQAYWFGLLTSIFGILQFLFMPMLGAISDRFGRRPVLIYSMSGLCLSFLVLAWSPSLAWLFVGRTIGGLSAASMAVASSYAADVSSAAERASSFARLGAASGLGFVCGPLLGGLLGAADSSFPFYVAAALSAANLVYGCLVVPESLPLSRRTPLSLAKFDPLRSLTRLAKRREARHLVLAFALMSFAHLMLQTSWVLYTTLRFDWTALDNGLALFCFGLSATLVQAGLMGALVKRLGERRVALLGLASGTIAFVLFGLARQGSTMYLLICCNMLSFASAPALQSLISRATSSSHQGELMGSLQSINSLGGIVIPLVGMGILGAASGLPSGDWRSGAPFFFCAVLQAGALLLAAVGSSLKERQPPAHGAQ